MNVGLDLKERLAADARLQILRELAEQTDGRLSILPLQRALDVYGIRRDRDWVFTQLRKLEALGAIEIQMAGEMPIARIARCGRDHLDERGGIEGVTRPAEAE
ncbi:hypothetical protein A3718_00865 [Erythrobacter sp. HI0019]|uniref:VpaChn25_0724 family phage protein n=1 Tax=unclassified Erythrobacter TaxID=2633097 RepID=UPI0007B87B76|nr:MULTISPECIES: hypothetical protein [unclassified Erythrobacter]KZX94636.1 hypothetical protein A3718_00865 [Erythrobacter sp. HI0019]KZY08830.1 hypothetical protein A3723_11775 [Erythrobacter sp. HI0028]